MYRTASFFAGVGGIDLGMEQTGRFKTVWANEVDPYPAVTFQANFPDVHLEVEDIKNLNPSDLPDVDVIVGGFPCQAFSVAGYRKGFDDEKGRGTLFFDMAKFIEEKKPQAVLLENVKNLGTISGGAVLDEIIGELQRLGYTVAYKVLNAMEYSDTPQNRERIYIVGFLDPKAAAAFEFPEKVERTAGIRDVIDFTAPVHDRYYYTPGKYKNNLYEKLDEAMTDPDAIYQWRRKYVRQNKSGVVPTLTANQGEGGHNVCLVRTPLGIRKMTPRECFNTQGFPDDFILPEKLSDGRLYKQAGNSVCVKVINRIAEKMADALDQSIHSMSSERSCVRSSTRSSKISSFS